MDVSTLIRDARARLEISCDDFSNLLGLKDTEGQIFRDWEAGASEPSSYNLKRILKIAGLENPPPFACKIKKPHYQFIDLFAGIGGFRLAFQEPNGECVFSSEINRNARITYAANFGEVPSGDICEIPASVIPDHDILLGGFPCQAFSQAGLKKGFKDTRGTLFFQIQRILAAKQPAAFVLENVKRLTTHDNKRTFETICQILRGDFDVSSLPKNMALSEDARKTLTTKLNYYVDFKVLKGTDFGIPQCRERVFIVGINRDKLSKRTTDADIQQAFWLPTPRQTHTTLADVLIPNEDLPRDESNKWTKPTISQKLWKGHKDRKLRNQKNGKGFGYSLFTHSSPYASTISARYYKDGSEILIDQTDIGLSRPRKLTPREAARLQGFPDTFRIDAVSDNELYKQMGNSVTIDVVKGVRNHLLLGMQQLELIDSLPKQINHLSERPPQTMLRFAS